MPVIIRGLVYLFYTVVAKNLPTSTTRIFGKISKKVRQICALVLFAKCGTNVNIEHGASFGGGSKLEIGDHSGIGINCQVPFDTRIGKYVMMGFDVVIIRQNHRFDRVDVPMMFQGS